MAGIAHMGVGLAAKHVAPEKPLWILLIAAYLIDIIWGVFWLAGIEHFPQKGYVATSPWSHGLFMSVVWSALAGLVATRIFHDKRSGVIIGLLVFSHWIVDFVAKPMLYSFPTDSGLPLLFNGSPTVGLGMWRTQIGQNIGEYTPLLLGTVIYILALIKQKRERTPKILSA